nr:immunoglobulin light chain junction region [Macaca mulatta]
CLQGDSPPCSF